MNRLKRRIKKNSLFIRSWMFKNIVISLLKIGERDWWNITYAKLDITHKWERRINKIHKVKIKFKTNVKTILNG